LGLYLVLVEIFIKFAICWFQLHCKQVGRQKVGSDTACLGCGACTPGKQRLEWWVQKDTASPRIVYEECGLLRLPLRHAATLHTPSCTPLPTCFRVSLIVALCRLWWLKVWLVQMKLFRLVALFDTALFSASPCRVARVGHLEGP
jgi:hypothetical protein